MFDRTKLSLQNRSKALWLLALAIAAGLILAGTAMTQAKPSGATSTQKAPAAKKAMAGKHEVVTITAGAGDNDPPTVNKPTVTLEKAQGDDMEWVCANNCDFVVVFTDSGKKPFKDRGFYKGKGKSGKITGAADTYKYWVIVKGGYIDPDVIIH